MVELHLDRSMGILFAYSKGKGIGSWWNVTGVKRDYRTDDPGPKYKILRKGLQIGTVHNVTEIKETWVKRW